MLNGSQALEYNDEDCFTVLHDDVLQWLNLCIRFKRNTNLLLILCVAELIRHLNAESRKPSTGKNVSDNVVWECEGLLNGAKNELTRFEDVASRDVSRHIETVDIVLSVQIHDARRRRKFMEFVPQGEVIRRTA